MSFQAMTPHLKKKGKKMKRFVFSALLLMSMTMAFADNEEDNTFNNVNAYHLNVNMKKLGETLNLSSDQLVFVEDAMISFSEDMMSIAMADGADRKAMLDNAVKKNLYAIHGTLTRSQYHKYLVLLNTTLNNRGLNK